MQSHNMVRSALGRGNVRYGKHHLVSLDGAVSARPWWKFYIANWRGDARIMACGAAARGVWFEMLLVMVEADPVGHLVGPDGAELSLKGFSRICGLEVPEIRSGITELERNGVFSRTENNTIFSRKMVRDWANSELQRARVGKRWAAEKAKQSVRGSDSGNTQSIPNGPKTEDRRKKERKEGSPKGDSSAPTKTNGHHVIPTPAQAAFDAYNAVATELGLPIAQVLTEARRKKIQARIAEHGVQRWCEALDIVRATPFLAGAEGQSGVATLDFLLQASSFVKVIEGSYARIPPGGFDAQSTRAQRAHAGRLSNLERALRTPAARR